MTIDRFREVLGAVGPPPDARELSELLWLACHISGPEETAPSVPPRSKRRVMAPPGPPDFTTPRPDAPVPVPPGPGPLTALHPPPGPSPVPGPAAGAAAEVLVPTAPMLADPLGVQRALRPLKRPVPSRHRTEVDEEATAARIADTRRWAPVLVPSPERWLSLTLVVDTGPTMRLWRPLARELAETLLRQGAFQDLHVSHLDTTGRVASAPGAPSQDAGTLLDASGRHAVLVLSDCSGPHWWDGRAAQAVRRWARAGPTAIVQPLPERLWRRTAAPAAPGMALLPRPGAPNTDLRFSPYDGGAAPGVPVPVLEVAPRWFGAWARLLSGSDPQPAAVATLPPRPPTTTPPPARERELPVAERVRRFLATASPAAAELAAHVAVSVPSLPVMRLIQHRILGRSGPGQLAEVLLSGLLRPVDEVRYEFVPGAREALLDTLPRPEAQHTRHVLEAVSAEIERRAGTSTETFRALLPTEEGPLTLTAETDHFALITPETRTYLAPATRLPAPATDLLDIQGASLDELLGENWDRPPQEVPIGVDDDLGIVHLELLSGRGRGPHGLITGPRDLRDRLLRTLVFGLALRHSPNVVNLAFADFSGGMSFVGLGSLPHVVTAVHTTSADAPVISRFPDVLETERKNRGAVLQDALTLTWDDYQAARAENYSFDPLPALVVIIDNAGPLLETRPDLIGPLTALTAKGEAQGIRFIFCSPESDGALPPELAEFVSWHMGASGAAGPGSAFLHVPGVVELSGFRPAHISLDATDPIVERMREGAGRVRRLAWPDEAASPPVAAEVAVSEPPSLETAAPPPGVPRFDVDDFVRRTRDHWHVLQGQDGEDHPDPAVAEVIRRLRISETRLPQERRFRHIVYGGTDMSRIAMLAAQYGHMLRDLGVLSHGNVRVATADWLGFVSSEPRKSMADLFRESRGGVLLLQMTREPADPGGAVSEGVFPEQLRSLVEEHGEDPIVVLCADAGQMIGLRRFDPYFTDRFRRFTEFPPAAATGRQPAETAGSLPELPELVYARELPAVTSRRIPIGIQHRPREPAYVHFDADPHLLVAGPPRSGRANALQLLIDGIRARPAGAATDVYVFDAHGILRSLAEEHGHAAFQVPEVGYTDSVEEFREVVDWFVREPPETEVFLFVIDRDLEDDPLRVFPRHLLTSFDNRVHLVLAKLLTVPDQRLDPMVSALHEAGAPALLLGSQYGEEHRLYEAEPPSGPGLVGRGVLVRGGRRHVVQVADRFG